MSNDALLNLWKKDLRCVPDWVWERTTLETLILVLLVVWLLGWLVVPVGGGLIHLLLVLILVVVVIRVLQGRSAVP